MYRRLVKYTKTYKSITVTKKFDDKHNLQRWIRRQRHHYNTTRLCANRIKRLESIGFVWNPLNAQWNEKYERLVAYKKQHTSTCVPFFYADDPPLASWVHHQRASYNINEPCLTADRIARLESIGFVWNVFDARWTEKYARLVKYKKEYKTTCVPYVYSADLPLGRWVREQQSYYNSNRSSLDVDRITQLDSIGFVWKIKDK